jgi:hypothetical protein
VRWSNLSSISSILQTEAQALSLALRMAQMLCWTYASFYYDNKTLVQAAMTDDLLSDECHWSMRPLLTGMQTCRRTRSYSVLKAPHTVTPIQDGTLVSV